MKKKNGGGYETECMNTFFVQMGFAQHTVPEHSKMVITISDYSILLRPENSTTNWFIKMAALVIVRERTVLFSPLPIKLNFNTHP